MSTLERINIPWPGWKVIRELGEGGYGKVYEIERTQHGITETDALKIVRIPKNRQQYNELAYRMTSEDSEAINAVFSHQKDKVIDEIRAMQQLKSTDNIVGIKDWGVAKLDDGYSWEIYIRMDVLTPLIQYIKNNKGMSEEEIISLGSDICSALVQCEKENIVHRDIKPDNIMVSASGRFMLTDFGIARYLENETTMTGIGSKPYMAPEVANYQKSDKTVDIYSLGLVLYEMLNNYRPPFVSAKGKYSALEREAAIQRRIKGEKLPPPAFGSEELKAIVLKACAAEPSQRYRSASEMLADLREIKQKPIDNIQATTIINSEGAATELAQEPSTIAVPPAGDATALETHYNIVADMGEGVVHNEIPISLEAGAAGEAAKIKPKKRDRKSTMKPVGICFAVVLALVCAALFATFEERKPIDEAYEDFRNTAEAEGWEVDELSHYSDSGNCYIYKAVDDYESAAVNVDIFNSEEELKESLEYDLYFSNLSEASESKLLSTNISSHISDIDDKEWIYAFKDNLWLYSCIDSDSEKQEFFKLLEALGVETPEEGPPTPVSVVPGHFLEKKESFDSWEVPVYELDTAITNAKSVRVGIKPSAVEGDPSGTYEIKFRSGGKWDNSYEVENLQADTWYKQDYSLKPGQTVEAMVLVPKTAHPETYNIEFAVIQVNERYVVGNQYVLKDEMNVRSSPEVKNDNLLKKEDLKGEDAANVADNTKDATLKKDSKVTCYEIKDNWMKVESGWICAYKDDEVYIDE